MPSTKKKVTTKKVAPKVTAKKANAYNPLVEAEKMRKLHAVKPKAKAAPKRAPELEVVVAVQAKPKAVKIEAKKKGPKKPCKK